MNANVIRFPNQNTLDTEIKQNQNPRNESFGGFFLKELIFTFFVSLHVMIIVMSKRYSGKSFKDSSMMKKSKLSLKEKRKLKKEKSKKTN